MAYPGFQRLRGGCLSSDPLRKAGGGGGAVGFDTKSGGGGGGGGVLSVFGPIRKAVGGMLLVSGPI